MNTEYGVNPKSGMATESGEDTLRGLSAYERGETEAGRQKEIRMVLGNLQDQIDNLQKCVWEFVERVEPVLSTNTPTPGDDSNLASPEMETELGRVLDDFAIRIVQIKDKVVRAAARVEL